MEYLLEENRILKQQLDATGKKLRLNDCQRRSLTKKGRILGWKKLMEYASIATPQAIYAWHRKLVANKYTAKRQVNTARQEEMVIIRELAVKFAEENPDWGYGRIQGALSNLGYHVCDTTVGNILRAKGIFPAPERKKRSTWRQFVRSHMAVINVADFFTTEVWTMRGLVRFHTLFVMNLATRKVHIAQNNCQTDGKVMAQVARNLTDGIDGFLNGSRYFICDHDALFTAAFRKTLKDSGIEVIQTRVGCPEQNGYAERFVKSIQEECLDKLIFVGEKSLRKAIRHYVEHYQHERNHQGIGNLIPFPYAAQQAERGAIISKSERLGGLLNYHHRLPGSVNRKEDAKAA